MLPLAPLGPLSTFRLALSGDMDLDPENGHFRLSATVPAVEANALRATLGVRPLPFPVAGAVRGVLHCTGPLEKPVFSGAWCGFVMLGVELGVGVGVVAAIRNNNHVCQQQQAKMCAAHATHPSLVLVDDCIACC